MKSSSGCCINVIKFRRLSKNISVIWQSHKQEFQDALATIFYSAIYQIFISVHDTYVCTLEENFEASQSIFQGQNNKENLSWKKSVI